MHAVPPLRGRFGRPYTFVDRCASTQRLLDGAPEGAIAVAAEQTEGRGRLGRSWQAPAGTSLLFSIVLEPPVGAERLPELSLVAGAAVAEAVETETGLTAEVKHPNDVLVGGRKVAGILAEAVDGRSCSASASISADRGQLSGAATATSLALEGATVDRDALLVTVLERLEARYDAWVTAAGT
jgi:BirA family biotin operon repressor/biotin-[acetyl-CoA-carboxylase] ligase